jgi:shikimate kinase
MDRQQIILCGFMGAGKSTLLHKLSANNSTHYFTDLDHEVLRSYRDKLPSLKELIHKIGWADFRQLEHLVLGQLLNSHKYMVLALGGGAFNSLNLPLLKQTQSIWLDVPLELCLKRIVNCPQRPLLKEKSRNQLEKLYHQRSSSYAQASFTLNPRQIAKINYLEDLIFYLGLT